MPSTLRSLLVAFPVALLLAFLTAPVAPVYALASPFPMPMPLAAGTHRHMSPAIDAHQRIKHVAANHSEVATLAVATSLTPRATASVYALLRTRTVTRHTRRAHAHGKRTNSTAQLQAYADAAVSSSSNLKDLAASSASQPDSDQDFQQQCASELTEFHTNFLAFSDLLGDTNTDDGLGEYDSSDAIETLLKQVVNANKNALSAVSVIVTNVPVVGPILGPIVYEIKCIIDGILDFTEDLTDGTLNAVMPLLQGILGQATTTACGSGINLAGLCL